MYMVGTISAVSFATQGRSAEIGCGGEIDVRAWTVIGGENAGEVQPKRATEEREFETPRFRNSDGVLLDDVYRVQLPYFYQLVSVNGLGVPF
jgi:hypothetical protein